jgi:hypothetical protein
MAPFSVFQTVSHWVIWAAANGSSRTAYGARDRPSPVRHDCPGRGQYRGGAALVGLALLKVRDFLQVVRLAGPGRLQQLVEPVRHDRRQRAGGAAGQRRPLQPFPGLGADRELGPGLHVRVSGDLAQGDPDREELGLRQLSRHDWWMVPIAGPASMAKGSRAYRMVLSARSQMR